MPTHNSIPRYARAIKPSSFCTSINQDPPYMGARTLSDTRQSGKRQQGPLILYKNKLEYDAKDTRFDFNINQLVNPEYFEYIRTELKQNNIKYFVSVELSFPNDGYLRIPYFVIYIATKKLCSYKLLEKHYHARLSDKETGVHIESYYGIIEFIYQYMNYNLLHLDPIIDYQQKHAHVSFIIDSNFKLDFNFQMKPQERETNETVQNITLGT